LRRAFELREVYLSRQPTFGSSLRRALTMGLILVLLSLNVSDAAARGERSVGSCPKSVLVRDYLAGLEGLPKQKGFAPSGKLGFGPNALRVYPPRTMLVVMGRDQIESSGALSKQSRSSRHLNWLVESQLGRIDRQGSLIGVAEVKRQEVSTVKSFSHRQFGFGSRVVPGLYRLSVTFASSRATLGSFKEYFRVIEERSSLSLTAPSVEARPGEIVKLRVKNLGTVSATYNAYPQLFTADGSRVPLDYGLDGNLRPRLQAGYLSPCIDLPLPATLAAGIYRITLGAKDRTMDQAKPLEATLYVGS